MVESGKWTTLRATRAESFAHNDSAFLPMMLLLRPPLFVLAALAAALLGGCVPVEHLDASPVAGQVVDRATRQPIAGAQVVLSVSSPDREARMPTSWDGRFHFPGFRHLELVPLPYGMYRAPSGHLHVEADGYRAYDRSEFFGNDDGPGYLDRNGNSPGSLQEVRIELDRKSKR